MSLRLDPNRSPGETEDVLRAAAAVAWGSDALPEIERAIPSAAAALWRISQEPLGPTDVEP